MASELRFDIGIGLENTHVLVTGGAGQIGQVIVRAFLAAGARVTALDINGSRMTMKHERLLWVQVDVTNEEKLEQAFGQARTKFGVVLICIAAAGLDLSFIPHHQSICDLPLDQWQRTIAVNTTGTFLTARTWLRGIRDHVDHPVLNASIIIIGSEAGVFGCPGNADYASSKAAVQYGLLRSLAPEASKYGHVRVNAVAPGPVNTPQFEKECAANILARYEEAVATVVLREPVPMEAVARACLMLASDTYSSHITGQVISVDSGKSGRLLWKQDGTSTW